MDINIDKLVTTKEKVYFFIVSCASLIIGIPYILALPWLCLTAFIFNGLFVGHLRQNAIRVSKKQFADIHEIVEDYSKRLGLKETPRVYIMQSGGSLNAFATRFLFKNIVVIFSDILELAYNQGEDAVKFIIAHELAHVKRKHISKMIITSLGSWIPFLGSAYSRACETTCDNIAAYLSDKNPADGLLVLLAGKKLYSKVKIDKFLLEAQDERGFWSSFAEITSSHPSLSTRIRNVMRGKVISRVEAAN